MTIHTAHASEADGNQRPTTTMDATLAQERVELLMKTLARIMKQMAQTNPEAVSQTGNA